MTSGMRGARRAGPARGRFGTVREFTVPPVVTVSDAVNLTDPVWDNASGHGDEVQFLRRTDAGWREVTCRQFRDEVVGLARGLLAAGVNPGDRVGLMSRTRYEWTVVDYAIWTVGAVTVPIYETSSAEQVGAILADSGAVACFVETAAHREIVAGQRDALPDLEHLWPIDPIEPLDRGASTGSLVDLVAAGAAVGADEVERRRRAVRAADLATIIYTSGTTGRPKGCTLTHRNIATDIGNAASVLDHIFRPDAVTLLFLPLAHSFARLIQVGVVARRVRTAHTADVANLLPQLADVRPTFVLAVPRVFEKVHQSARQRAHADGRGAIFDRAAAVAIAWSEALDSPGGPGALLRLRHALFDRLVYGRLRAAFGGRCDAAISGGAPLGDRLAHFFRGIGITVYEGYGLTETSPAVAVNTREHLRIGTVGRPLPGVSVRVGDDGEILVRGDIVFPGYWRDPDATAELVDPDGWLHTGDLGQLDDDGYLSITGRKKEIIVTAGGKNVSPAVLEDRVRAHPLVSQCVVVGDRQPFVAALVTLDPDALADWCVRSGRPRGTTAADLRADPDLRAELQAAVDDANARANSRAESVRAFRILPGDLTETNGTLTPSLKVKRTVVMKEYADEIAAIYR
jgi:long-chain acyl-CoA synthetase